MLEIVNQFYSKIVGSTFAPGSQEKIKTLKKKDLLSLVREPNNKFDKNAVAVYTEDKIKLGYLPKEVAANLVNQTNDNFSLVEVEVSEVTGKEEKNVGCNVLIKILKQKD